MSNIVENNGHPLEVYGRQTWFSSGITDVKVSLYIYRIRIHDSGGQESIFFKVL